MRELKIDPQIAEVLAPLTRDERRGLLESIQEEGVRDPIVVWKGHDIIADGHNRYGICNEYGYDFEVVEREWDDIDDVLAWVIKNQLGKRNVTEEQRSDLVGRLYATRKKQHGGQGGNRYTVVESTEPQYSVESKTIEVVAEETGVSPDTVRKAYQRYEVKQELAEKTSPATVLEIVSLPERVGTPLLAVLNDQVDNNPAVVEEFKAMSPYQRSKLASLVRGTAYLDHLDSVQLGTPDGNTCKELAEKFRISKRHISQTDRDFTALVNKTNAIDSALADWIMNARQFPIKSAGVLLTESGEPNIKMLKFVRDLMEGASGKKKLAFDKAIVEWEEFCKAKEVGKKLSKVAAESDRKVDEMFGGSTSMCIPPNARELFCEDCEWGFDTFLPEPGEGVSCPYCKGSRIVIRDSEWEPRR